MFSFGILPKLLSRDYQVTILDFYGFGESISPKPILNLSDYVEGLKTLIEECKISKAILVGHSFGGRVALLFAAKYPQYVHSLVLIDAAGIKPRRGLRYYTKIGVHKLLKRFGLAGLAGSSDYQKLSDDDKATFRNIVNEDLSPLLKDITVPTLLLWGKKDKDTPLYMAKKLKNNIRNSDLVVFSKAGHFSYLDEPTATYAVIKYFLLQC